MNKKKLHLGLIGKDVSKSDSERIHRFILKELDVECEYEKFSVAPEEFDNAMRCLMLIFIALLTTKPFLYIINL